ncbi:hypothetical protein NQ176_g560 [Zarea fungicola]|uniref:Uncharacterized protein n=1 Tax=Zarea fungicola TaxID=93591 RepID=A0ACC1NWX2_9HYPO|nr:hypothetical protein NQ176_g560 [Lecanicillium fungicola]
MRNTARVFVHVMDWFIPTSTAAGPPRRYTGSQISDTLRRIVKHDRSFMQLHAPADAVPPDLSEQEVDVACHEIEMAVIEAVRKYSNFFESPQGLQTLQKRLRSDDMEGYAARFTNDSAWTEVLSAVEGLFLHAFSVPWVDNSGAGRATGRVDHEQENVPVHASGIQTNSSERAVGEAMDHAWPLPATEAVSERESQAPQIGSTQMERQQQAIPPPHTEPRSSVQDMMSMQTAGVQCPVPSIQPLTSMMQALRQDMAAEDEKLTAAMRLQLSTPTATTAQSTAAASTTATSTATINNLDYRLNNKGLDNSGFHSILHSSNGDSISFDNSHGNSNLDSNLDSIKLDSSEFVNSRNSSSCGKIQLRGKGRSGSNRRSNTKDLISSVGGSNGECERKCNAANNIKDHRNSGYGNGGVGEK